MPAPLNILFITADQWRGDCLSARGHSMVRTPHLDALARKGVLFARHYANAAPCGPSRASLHTGMYLQNHRSGTNGTPLDTRHTNWALEAAGIGYDPVLVGYTDTSRDPRGLNAHSPWLSTYEGPLPGIRPVEMMGTWPTAWAEQLRRLGYPTPDDERHTYGMRADGPEYEDGAAAPRPLLYPAEVDDTAFLVNAMRRYVEEAAGPWVAHLSLLRPHPPWVAPAPYNAMYDPAQTPASTQLASPQDEARQHPWLAWQLGVGDGDLRRSLFRAPDNPGTLRRMKAVYYGLISEVDAALGRLVAFLKDTGRYDDTLIIFTSDHGEQMGDHWLLGKCGYFDASYHIPLIICDPRPDASKTRGSVVSAFTENVDIMPTLLEAIGLEPPVQCDGKSLMPFLHGPAPSGAPPQGWRQEAHWEYDFRAPADPAAEQALGLTLHQCNLSVIRSEHCKYVHFAGLAPLFFDLDQDPEEFVNRANDPACAPQVLACAQNMLSWRMTHDEQTLTHIQLTEDGPISRKAPRY